jgi:glucose/arabinose dehydrogenase
MRPIRVALRSRGLISVAAMVLCAALIAQAGPGPAGASTLPSGFRDSVALSGLTNPTVLQFAPDGRIFVGQKNGVIKVFQSLTDTNPVTFADLSGEVDDYWDRGLLGLALSPNFPANPYVYVLYAYDAPIGGTPPAWNDGCPTPPGPTTDGCLVSARVSRLQISGNVMTGSEQVLINDWCQQFPSHSIGTLLFGRDGYLYVGGGDGASFNNVDYGQYGASYAGDQANPCGDPPGAAGTALSPPGAEGGALRSQSVRRTDGPATLDGAVLRIDPATGAGVPGNPFYSSSDANARRIVAYGLRNPSALPSARAATNCGSATSAGAPGRRSTAWCRRRVRPPRTSAGRAMREPHPRAATRAPASTCARPCTRRLARSSRRTTPTTTAPAS